MSARAEADTVAVEVREGIAWVRFNRPEKRNAMSPGLNRQMLRVINELEFREEVGVLVLAGEGVAWSAGMDLKEYFRETEARGLSGVRHSQREAYAWWERLRASIDLPPADHTEPLQAGNERHHVGTLDIESAARLALGDAGASLDQHEQRHARVPQAERREPQIELGQRA